MTHILALIIIGIVAGYVFDPRHRWLLTSSIALGLAGSLLAGLLIHAAVYANLAAAALGAVLLSYGGRPFIDRRSL